MAVTWDNISDGGSRQINFKSGYSDFQRAMNQGNTQMQEMFDRDVVLQQENRKNTVARNTSLAAQIIADGGTPDPKLMANTDPNVMADYMATLRGQDLSNTANERSYEAQMKNYSIMEQNAKRGHELSLLEIEQQRTNEFNDVWWKSEQHDLAVEEATQKAKLEDQTYDLAEESRRRASAAEEVSSAMDNPDTSLEDLVTMRNHKGTPVYVRDELDKLIATKENNAPEVDRRMMRIMKGTGEQAKKATKYVEEKVTTHLTDIGLTDASGAVLSPEALLDAAESDLADIQEDRGLISKLGTNYVRNTDKWGRHMAKTYRSKAETGKVQLGDALKYYKNISENTLPTNPQHGKALKNIRRIELAEIYYKSGYIGVLQAMQEGSVKTDADIKSSAKKDVDAALKNITL